MSSFTRTSAGWEENPCARGEHNYIEFSKRTRRWSEKELVQTGEREVRGTPFIDGSSESHTEGVYAAVMVSYEADTVKYRCTNCGNIEERVEDAREVGRRRALF